MQKTVISVTTVPKSEIEAMRRTFDGLPKANQIIATMQIRGANLSDFQILLDTDSGFKSLLAEALREIAKETIQKELKANNWSLPEPDVEDAIQNMWLYIWEAILNFNPLYGTPIRRYLGKFLRKAKDFIVKSMDDNSKKMPLDEMFGGYKDGEEGEEINVFDEQTPSPEKLAEVNDLIQKIMERLTPRQRSLFEQLLSGRIQTNAKTKVQIYRLRKRVMEISQDLREHNLLTMRTQFANYPQLSFQEN